MLGGKVLCRSIVGLLLTLEEVRMGASTLCE